MATEEPPRRRRAAPPKSPSDDAAPSDIVPSDIVPSDIVPSGSPGASSSITSLATAREATRRGRQEYVTPIVHFHVSERLVNVGFWGALAGSAALGVVDLPLAALIGGAVYVARHHARSGT